MNTQDFDRLLNSIHELAPEAETVHQAAAHVRDRLQAEAGSDAAANVARLANCGDFRALLGAYRAGTLNEARRMLVQDHLHACVACRKVFQGAGKAAVVPIGAGKMIVPRIAAWAVAAGVIVAAAMTLPPVLDRALAPSGPRATLASVDGAIYRVSDRGAMALATGAAIGENEEIRTAKGSRAVLRLRDGSTVEMAERSDLRLSERWRGKTVRLERGEVMVEAARQRRGRLEVATPDCLVSVKGTIFAVTRGIKGSRVSVVEGQVNVEHGGATNVLLKGEQTATSPNVARTSVAEDVSWSRNAAKYLAQLGELAAIQKKIEAISGPGLRYESKLAGLLPENTVVFASIPNLGSTLAEANRIFEDRVRESAVLREWWNDAESQKLRLIVDRVRSFSDYLGDEVVLAVPGGGGRMQDPVLVAEARRPELRGFLEQQFAAMKMMGAAAPPVFLDGPEQLSAARSRGPLVMVHGNVVALGSQPAMLARVAAISDAGGRGGFLATPFWARISQSYHSGAGWVFAADMEQIIARDVQEEHKAMTNAASKAGIDNVRYLVIERKENLGRTENRAALSFAGTRRGVASWLASPGPMGSLDFVSPEASFAGTFVVKNPGTLLQELIAMAGSQPEAAEYLAKFQQETGINLLDDVASTLGGEMTVAVDGPLLPTPSWKVAVEVDNPERLEWSIEQAVKTAQRDLPDAGVQFTSEQAGALRYYTLTSSKSSMEIDYVFTDGYLLIAPSRGLLTTSIQSRSTGMTLARSSNFRNQLPQDGYLNFSALLYYNLGSAVGPLVDQLKSSGLMTPEQQQSAALLTENREPVLIYAYGEPDRILVASRSGFFGLGLDTLLGLNGRGPTALQQLLPPVFAQKKILREAGSSTRQ